MGATTLVSVIGLAVGSFLGVVSDRIDTAESILWGRSHCNHCKQTLRWWELLPLLGYVLVRGACPRCRSRIPKSYLVFELLTALAFGLIWQVASQDAWYLIASEYLLLSVLLVLCFYDWQHQAFPASLLYGAIAGGALVAVLRVTTGSTTTLAVLDPFFTWLNTPQSVLWQLILGACVGVGFLGLIALPSRGMWMGYGDVFLIAALGFWVGYPQIIVALLTAFYAGALVGIGLLVTRRLGDDHRLPFGPFLVAGGVVARVWGPSLFMSIMKLWGAI